MTCSYVFWLLSQWFHGGSVSISLGRLIKRLINPLESQIFRWGLYGYLMAIFELNVQHGWTWCLGYGAPLATWLEDGGVLHFMVPPVIHIFHGDFPWIQRVWKVSPWLRGEHPASEELRHVQQEAALEVLDVWPLKSWSTSGCSVSFIPTSSNIFRHSIFVGAQTKVSSRLVVEEIKHGCWGSMERVPENRGLMGGQCLVQAQVHGLSRPWEGIKPSHAQERSKCQNTNMLGRHGFMMLYDGLFTLVTFSSHQSSRCLWSGFIEAVLTHPLTRASRASVPPVAAMAAKDPQWAGGVTFGQDGNLNICAATGSL